MRVLLDGWQLSGESDWVTGDWAPVMFTTVDNFDFTGGEGGQGTDLGGGSAVQRCGRCWSAIRWPAAAIR